MSAAGGAAAAAATMQAIRASGVVVFVEPNEFLGIRQRQQAPLVVRAAAWGLFGTTHQYLTSYKGLGFFAKSPTPLTLPATCEIVRATSIWAPG